MRSLVGLFLAFTTTAVSVGACSSGSSSSTAPDGGGRDASVADSRAPGDSGSEENAPFAPSCTVDGGPGIPCPASVADVCDADAGSYGWACGTTWESIQASPPCAVAQYAAIFARSCGAHDGVFITSVDSALGAIYDAPAGTLVALVNDYNSQLFCIAGPPCLPTSTASCASGTQLQLACGADGGSDASSSDGGPSDGGPSDGGPG